ALGKPPETIIDENEIRQLILNMARNGMEAMPPGGMLTIGTTVDGNKVVLFIKDQGHGMDPGLIEKLGTPFLTTKEKGTGLGMAVCYSIASRNNARIEVETSPAGTTFMVYFPAVVEQLKLF
ncbi:MAG TPA: ATP-binding protein, partial [Syntrophomonadaceae bacterium]|nr:ATP-binding protein [Syntrophomonadaceae bacterium]